MKAKRRRVRLGRFLDSLVHMVLYCFSAFALGYIGLAFLTDVMKMDVADADIIMDTCMLIYFILFVWGYFIVDKVKMKNLSWWVVGATSFLAAMTQVYLIKSGVLPAPQTGFHWHEYVSAIVFAVTAICVSVSILHLFDKSASK